LKHAQEPLETIAVINIQSPKFIFD